MRILMKYIVNAKIQGDQDISEGARQITTEQTEQLKKLFKSAKKAVEEVGIMKEPLELAIPLLRMHQCLSSKIS